MLEKKKKKKKTAAKAVSSQNNIYQERYLRTDVVTTKISSRRMSVSLV